MIELCNQRNVTKKTRKNVVRFFIQRQVCAMSFSYCQISFLSKAVVQRISVKKMFLKILQNSHENICARVSFLKKLQVCRPEAYNFIKKLNNLQLAQVFCEDLKITFSYIASLEAASVEHELSFNIRGYLIQGKLFCTFQCFTISNILKEWFDNIQSKVNCSF